MPRYIITATKDVGYQTVIEAPNEETAYSIADDPTEEQAAKFKWVQTDNGHDWTLEHIWELKDDEAVVEGEADPVKEMTIEYLKEMIERGDEKAKRLLSFVEDDDD